MRVVGPNTRSPAARIACRNAGVEVLRWGTRNGNPNELSLWQTMIRQSGLSKILKPLRTSLPRMWCWPANLILRRRRSTSRKSRPLRSNVVPTYGVGGRRVGHVSWANRFEVAYLCGFGFAKVGHSSLRLAAARTVNPAPLPSTPQFSTFLAYYLTSSYRHAILPRVCHSPAASTGFPGSRRHPSTPLPSPSWR